MPLLGVRAADTPVVSGPVSSTVRFTVTASPQLPWLSWACTKTVCDPSDKPSSVAVGRVPSMLTTDDDGLTDIGFPVPSVPCASMKYSAAVTSELPEALSSAVAERSTGAALLAFTRLGLSCGSRVAGPPGRRLTRARR